MSHSSLPPRRALLPRWLDLALLAHPAWWAALAVLLVNDNLLKGRGVAPAWLTGKLSDFAFVVVAPVLFAALLPRALPRRRTLALLSVVGLFVAADLSRGVSDAFEAVMATLGVRSKLWPDPTDLLALAASPLTVYLMRRPPRTPRRWTRASFERAGVIVGAFACIATTAPPSHQHGPYLVNAAPGGAATVRVTWVLRQVSCDAPADVAASLGPSDLEDPRTLVLARGQVAALDGIPPPGVSSVGQCTTRASVSTDCVAAILETESAPPALLVATAKWTEWDSGAFFSCNTPPSPISHCMPTVNPDAAPDRDAVTLRLVDGALRFTTVETNTMVHLFPIDPAAVAARPTSDAGCRSLREAYRALLVAPTCAVNTDCTSRQGLPIPDDAPPCHIIVNAGSISALDDLAQRWSDGCFVTSGPSCGAAQPAVCRGGRCEEECPGVDVPNCPRSCDFATGAGDSCAESSTCMTGDGRVCTCQSSRLACADMAPAAPGCPLTCLTYPGGGSAPWEYDAGTSDAHPPDGDADGIQP